MLAAGGITGPGTLGDADGAAEPAAEEGVSVG
jgi:hypothetical protein